MKRKYFIGDIYPTNCGVDAQIIATEGFGRQRVMIKWLDEHGYECVVKSSHLNEGKVANPYAKLMRGVGYMGVGDYSAHVNGVRTLEYDTWKGIFQRCYDEKHNLTYPTYLECSLSSKWECFQDFAGWANTQMGWGLKGWHLDKDLLVRGNKEYGPDFCIMLPEKLNQIITNRTRFRGQYPVGVYKGSGRNQFTAQFNELDGSKRYKRFWTVGEAFVYYKTNKERVIREAADMYKSQIDPKAYQALMSWEINIDD